VHQQRRASEFPQRLGHAAAETQPLTSGGYDDRDVPVLQKLHWDVAVVDMRG
jgi:hypothetical protein